MKNFDWLLKTPIAHRGLHGKNIEENSMSAFRAAADAGFPIETDLHLLRDGELAVFHDYDLKRITGHDIKIENLSSGDLEKYPMKIGGEKIPLLKDLFSLAARRVPLLLEIKSESLFDRRIEKALLKALESYPGKDRVAIQSFNQYSVRYIHNTAPQYPAGQLASRFEDRRPRIKYAAFRNLRVLDISRPDFVSYDIGCMPDEILMKKRAKGMKVLAWTVDSEEKLALAQVYADNIIFEGIRLGDKS